MNISAGLVLMKLVELEAGANIILQVQMKAQIMEFPSTVFGTDENGILAEPVRVDQKVVGFGGEGIRLSVILIRQDKPPFIWKNVRCVTVLAAGATRYQITAFNEGYEMNRRQAFRLFIGINGIVQVGINHKAVEVIVKDVSETGFSFVSTQDIDTSMNTPIRLVFMDLNRNYSLMGLLVRKVILGPNKVLYGCHLSVKNQELCRYINEKQRQQLSMNHNNAAYRKRELLQQSLREGFTDPADPAASGVQRPARRKIDNVEKEERREAFKEKHAGKKV